MRQPTKNKLNTLVSVVKKRKKKRVFQKSKNASELDGSGLETYFRINFLDKLGLNYDQQFKANDIGRFYDFHLKDKNNNSLMILLEIDGTFFHSDSRFYNKILTSSQKRNKRIDKIKDRWALDNGYLLLRFLEYDIKNNPKLILDVLSEHIKKILF